jgi:hypothetical protein
MSGERRGLSRNTIMEGSVALLGPAETMKTEKHKKTFDLCGSAHGLCTYTGEDMKHRPDHQR